MQSLEVETAVSVTACVFGSVLLVCSCLLFHGHKRRKSKEGSRDSRDGKPEKGSEKHGKITGLTNTAFEVGHDEATIPQTDLAYDYAKPEYNKRTIDKVARIPELKSEQAKDNRDDDATRDDLPGRIYHTLERRPANSAEFPREYDEYSNSENSATEESYVIVLHENIYDEPEKNDGSADEEIAEDADADGRLYHTLERPCNREKANEMKIETPSEHDDSSINDSEQDDCSFNECQAIYDQPDENTEEIFYRRIENESTTVEAQKATRKEVGDTCVINIPTEIEKINNYKKETKNHVVCIPDDNDNTRAELAETLENENTGYSQHLSTQEEKSRQQEDGCMMETPDDIYQNVHQLMYRAKPTSGSQENRASTQSQQVQQNSTNNMNDMQNFSETTLADSITANVHDTDNTDEVNVSDIPQNEDEAGMDGNMNNVYQNVCDDDIYEDWEDNIIARVIRDKKESFSGQYVNEGYEIDRPEEQCGKANESLRNVRTL